MAADSRLTCGHHTANWIFQDEESGHGFCGTCHPEKLTPCSPPAGEAVSALPEHCPVCDGAHDRGNPCAGPKQDGDSGALVSIRQAFEDAVIASDEYQPAHMCETGEPDDPEPESCIPCMVVRTARALIAAERADAAKRAVDGMHIKFCGCHDLRKCNDPGDDGPDHGHPYSDSGCLAARERAVKESTDAK